MKKCLGCVQLTEMFAVTRKLLQTFRFRRTVASIIVYLGKTKMAAYANRFLCACGNEEMFTEQIIHSIPYKINKKLSRVIQSPGGLFY